MDMYELEMWQRACHYAREWCQRRRDRDGELFFKLWFWALESEIEKLR